MILFPFLKTLFKAFLLSRVSDFEQFDLPSAYRSLLTEMKYTFNKCQIGTVKSLATAETATLRVFN